MNFTNQFSDDMRLINLQNWIKSYKNRNMTFLVQIKNFIEVHCMKHIIKVRCTILYLRCESKVKYHFSRCLASTDNVSYMPNIISHERNLLINALLSPTDAVCHSLVCHRVVFYTFPGKLNRLSCSHCFVMRCVLTMGIVASQYPSSMDAEHVMW